MKPFRALLRRIQQYRCPSCGKWFSFKEQHIEVLDDQNQLRTETCTSCNFIRRHIERIPEDERSR
jgi:hypothetical protein